MSEDRYIPGNPVKLSFAKVHTLTKQAYVIEANWKDTRLLFNTGHIEQLYHGGEYPFQETSRLVLNRKEAIQLGLRIIKEASKLQRDESDPSNETILAEEMEELGFNLATFVPINQVKEINKQVRKITL